MAKGIRDRGSHEMRTLQDIANKLHHVVSAPPYESARDYAVRVLGRSNSAVSTAIRYPETISDTMLQDLSSEDPRNFANAYERVLLARVKDGAPQLMENAAADPEQIERLRELILISMDAMKTWLEATDSDN